MKTTVILWSLAMLFVVVRGQIGDQELLVRPNRPAAFQDQREVKEYLDKLRTWAGSFSSSRYGKRNYMLPKMTYNRNNLKQPKWKNDYDYYSQYNI